MITFFLFMGLFSSGLLVVAPVLFLIYKLGGGKRGFISWFKAMQF